MIVYYTSTCIIDGIIILTVYAPGPGTLLLAGLNLSSLRHSRPGLPLPSVGEHSYSPGPIQTGVCTPLKLMRAQYNYYTGVHDFVLS